MYCTYAHTYITIKIDKYTFSPFRILMSVVMETVVALKYVQTLKEVSTGDVIVALSWMMMELLVMVCIQMCPYMTSTVKSSLI